MLCSQPTLIDLLRSVDLISKRLRARDCANPSFVLSAMGEEPTRGKLDCTATESIGVALTVRPHLSLHISALPGLYTLAEKSFSCS